MGIKLFIKISLKIVHKFDESLWLLFDEYIKAYDK